MEKASSKLSPSSSSKPMFSVALSPSLLQLLVPADDVEGDLHLIEAGTSYVRDGGRTRGAQGTSCCIVACLVGLFSRLLASEPVRRLLANKPASAPMCSSHFAASTSTLASCTTEFGSQGTQGWDALHLTLGILRDTLVSSRAVFATRIPSDDPLSVHVARSRLVL